MERMSSIWTIRRSATDVKLTGLCGGVAQHWGIDPLLVRVGWALLALSSGIGLVLYLAGWLLIPVEGSNKSVADDLFGESVRRWPKELWITLVVVASLATITFFGWLSPFTIGPAIVIAVIWYFGFYKGRQAKSAAPPAQVTDAASKPAQPTEFVQYPGPATPFTEAAQAWQRRIEEHTRQTAAETPTTAVPPTVGPPTVGPPTVGPPTAEWPSPPTANLSQPISDPAASEHNAFLAEPDPVGLYVESAPAAPVKMSATTSAKRLRLVSLIVLGLTLSCLGVLQAVGIALPLASYLAAALLVIGLTLIAATWLGRARGLLPLGVVLAIAVMIVTAGGPELRVPTAASSSHAYTTVAELPVAGDSAEFGKLSIDLSQLAVTADASYTAHVDLGRLEVTVPKDANVVINYSADMGDVRAYGNEIRGGSDLKGQIPDPQPQPGQHTLTLNLSVDAGNVEVQR
jgi:phage shock protein PspC (stress-responsive transcriptional regulator)